MNKQDKEALRAAHVLSNYCESRESCFKTPKKERTDCILYDVCSECMIPQEWVLPEPGAKRPSHD